jgi:uncharacterized protein YdeI (YjbR/CyaY-like superfamily)
MSKNIGIPATLKDKMPADQALEKTFEHFSSYQQNEFIA